MPLQYILRIVLIVCCVVVIGTMVYTVYKYCRHEQETPLDRMWTNFLDYSSDAPMLSEYMV